jgi:predicted O-methyltransferase YrrM
MPTSFTDLPPRDPVAIFEIFRGSYGTELLTAAVAHFDVFTRLAAAPRSFEDWRADLGLRERPARVLSTALRAMGLLAVDEADRFVPTDLARDHLVRGGRFFVGDYVGLAAESPGTREMVARLRTDRPAGADDGTGAAFVFREGLESAMEREATARHLTLALAGRARCTAPVMAARLACDGMSSVLDVGGGTGIYSIALVQRNPRLRAVVFDRPEVLKVAEETAREAGVAERVELVPGDMFADPLPGGHDVVLLSNILHDWDVPQCRDLVARCAAACATAGEVWIHDVFLNDALDGPLPIALYSAALFTLTEGRAYSAAEYGSWLRAAGLEPGPIVPTAVHCGVLTARRLRKRSG